jgi:hypothetical protein
VPDQQHTQGSPLTVIMRYMIKVQSEVHDLNVKQVRQ